MKDILTISTYGAYIQVGDYRWHISTQMDVVSLRLVDGPGGSPPVAIAMPASNVAELMPLVTEVTRP